MIQRCTRAFLCVLWEWDWRAMILLYVLLIKYQTDQGGLKQGASSQERRSILRLSWEEAPKGFSL